MHHSAQWKLKHPSKNKLWRETLKISKKLQMLLVIINKLGVENVDTDFWTEPVRRVLRAPLTVKCVRAPTSMWSMCDKIWQNGRLYVNHIEELGWEAQWDSTVEMNSFFFSDVWLQSVSWLTCRAGRELKWSREASQERHGGGKKPWQI